MERQGRRAARRGDVDRRGARPDDERGALDESDELERPETEERKIPRGTLGLKLLEREVVLRTRADDDRHAGLEEEVSETRVVPSGPARARAAAPRYEDHKARPYASPSEPFVDLRASRGIGVERESRRRSDRPGAVRERQGVLDLVARARPPWLDDSPTEEQGPRAPTRAHAIWHARAPRRPRRTGRARDADDEVRREPLEPSGEGACPSGHGVHSLDARHALGDGADRRGDDQRDRRGGIGATQRIDRRQRDDEIPEAIRPHDGEAAYVVPRSTRGPNFLGAALDLLDHRPRG